MNTMFKLIYVLHFLTPPLPAPKMKRSENATADFGIVNQYNLYSIIKVKPLA